MGENVLLSICVPTYNRYGKLRPMLRQLLSCERSDYEIIIQDNCSSDGTRNVVDDLNDSRIRLIENPVNIGGIINGYGALLAAFGKYCMICLDKDCVLGTELSLFLETLEVAPDIKYGFCDLNVSEQKDNERFLGQEERFTFFAYRSRHPSGMFWNTELLRSCFVASRILKTKAVFGFFTELIFAECACKEGNGLHYRKPLIITETPEESAHKKTLTYTVSQIFFFPKNRIFEFKAYLGQLQKLKLRKKMRLWLKVFIRGLLVTTVGFRGIMQDNLHLEHYGVAPRNVGKLELIGIAFRYIFSVSFSSRRKVFERLFNDK